MPIHDDILPVKYKKTFIQSTAVNVTEVAQDLADKLRASAIDERLPQFIADKKYDPQWKSVWIEVAKELSADPSALQRYFDFLLAMPRDLYGLYEVLLHIRLLAACDGGRCLKLEIREHMLKTIRAWIEKGVRLGVSTEKNRRIIDLIIKELTYVPVFAPMILAGQKLEHRDYVLMVGERIKQTADQGLLDILLVYADPDRFPAFSYREYHELHEWFAVFPIVLKVLVEVRLFHPKLVNIDKAIVKLANYAKYRAVYNGLPQQPLYYRLQIAVSGNYYFELFDASISNSWRAHKWVNKRLRIAARHAVEEILSQHLDDEQIIAELLECVKSLCTCWGFTTLVDEAIRRKSKVLILELIDIVRSVRVGNISSYYDLCEVSTRKDFIEYLLMDLARIGLSGYFPEINQYLLGHAEKVSMDSAFKAGEDVGKIASMYADSDDITVQAEAECLVSRLLVLFQTARTRYQKEAALCGLAEAAKAENRDARIIPEMFAIWAAYCESCDDLHYPKCILRRVVSVLCASQAHHHDEEVIGFLLQRLKDAMDSDIYIYSVEIKTLIQVAIDEGNYRGLIINEMIAYVESMDKRYPLDLVKSSGTGWLGFSLRLYDVIVDELQAFVQKNLLPQTGYNPLIGPCVRIMDEREHKLHYFQRLAAMCILADAVKKTPDAVEVSVFKTALSDPSATVRKLAVSALASIKQAIPSESKRINRALFPHLFDWHKRPVPVKTWKALTLSCPKEVKPKPQKSAKQSAAESTMSIFLGHYPAAVRWLIQSEVRAALVTLLLTGKPVAIYQEPDKSDVFVVYANDEKCWVKVASPAKLLQKIGSLRAAPMLVSTQSVFPDDSAVAEPAHIRAAAQ